MAPGGSFVDRFCERFRVCFCCGALSVPCSLVITCWSVLGRAGIWTLLRMRFPCVLSLYRMVSQLRCGTWLYRFLIFVFFQYFDLQCVILLFPDHTRLRVWFKALSGRGKGCAMVCSELDCSHSFGDHLIRQSKMVNAISVEGVIKNISVKLFWIWTRGSGGDANCYCKSTWYV